jgi:glycosyltransferase involved in cell wall biosynthesis
MESKVFLFIPDNALWGGSELLWSKSAIQLAYLGHRVHVLHRSTMIFPIEINDEFIKSKVRLRHRPISSSTRIITEIKNRIFKSFSFIHIFRSLIKSINPDVIVFNQGYNFNSYDTWQLVEDLCIPFVTISHALNEHYWPSSIQSDRLRIFFHQSKHNYFVSHANVLITSHQIASVPGRFSVIKNPVYSSCISGPIKYPDTDPTYNLAFVGRFDFKSKGQDLILDVLSSDKWRQRSVHINFYGNGSDEAALQKLINYKGLNNATICGYTSPEAIWALNHALVLTSRYEGLPIVIPEAMLSGRIPIVTDVSGNPELIIDNETGFIARGTTPSSIDEALERAWNNRFNWKQMGLKARDSILHDYSPSPELVFANKLLSLLD